MADVHPSAIVEDGAVLGEDVTVGPFCMVGSQVVLEVGVTLKAHVVLGGRTIVGPNSVIFPFASIGQQPQDLKYRGEESELIIGANTVIREHVTMNPGTVGGGLVNTASANNTTIGGGAYNTASAQFATIGGGGSTLAATGNRVTDDWGTVGGGEDNQPNLPIMLTAMDK